MFGLVVLLAGHGSLLRCEAQSPDLEQQLHQQFAVTTAGNNGAIVQAGAVVIIQKDGIRALPVSDKISPESGHWPNSYKKGGQVSTSFIQEVNYAQLKPASRLVQVGEKAYVTSLQIKLSKLVFGLQTCSDDPNQAPFRAHLSFDFKGIDATDIKQVQSLIGEVLTIDSSLPKQPAGAPPMPPAAPPVQLKLPAVYVSSQTPSDQLQLNADKSFSLQEGGQSYHGTFTETGEKLELSIIEANTTTTVTVQGNNLADTSGHAWVLQEQKPKSGTSAGALNNQDVVKMAKAGFDDEMILAKIKNSQCQFDTSTDALIQLKHDGVTSSVIKAMVAAK